MSKKNSDELRPTMRVVNATPAMCRKWLASQHKNRSVRAQKVAMWAREMTEGRWKLNGSSILFDKDDRMFDGQHRCLASIQTDLSFPTYVGRGFDYDETMASLDAGAPRSIKDYLGFAGYKNTSILAGAAAQFADIAADQPPKSKGKKMVPSGPLSLRSEMLAYIKRYPRLVDAADLTVRHRKELQGWIPPSVFGGCVMAFAEMIDPEFAMEFGDAFATGAGLGAGSPALLVRNRLMRSSMDPRTRMTKKAKCILMIRSWAYWVTGTGEGSKLSLRDTSTYPTVIGPDDSLSKMWQNRNTKRAKERSK